MSGWRVLLFCIVLGAVGTENRLFAADTPSSPAPLTVLQVTPDGEDVPAGRQIVITFNRPVVPIGRMERKAEELPVTITPPLPCEWRWLNTSSLSCHLAEKNALVLATHYRLEIRPGIKAEDGATLAETYHGDFMTIRPAITWPQFHVWKAPGHPVVRLVFNQPVTQDSVERHIYMLAAGAQKHWFGPPTDARIALRASADTDARVMSGGFLLPGSKFFAFLRKPVSQKSDDDRQEVNGEEARRVWLVEPKGGDIALDAHVVLKMEEGVVSAQGPEAGRANDDVVEFDTFPAFAFLGVSCVANDNRRLQFLTEAGLAQVAESKDQDAPQRVHLRRHHRHGLSPEAVTIASGQREEGQGEGKCDPLAPIDLMFNAPVERADVMKALDFTPAIKGWSKLAEEENASEEPEEGAADYQKISWMLKRTHEKGQVYEVWLPYGLKAAEQYRLESRRASMGYFARLWHYAASFFGQHEPVEVADMFDRRLRETAEASFLTDHRKPNFILEHHDAVLEKAVDSDVPVYVDNVKTLTLAHQTLTVQGGSAQETHAVSVPAAADVQFAMPSGVRAALGGRTGALYGHFSTEPVIPLLEYQNRIFAEVTPYQMHMKFGHFNSLVWVADLATGLPVEGAKVRLYRDMLTRLSVPESDIADAVTDASGIAVLPGTQTIDPDLTLSAPYKADNQEQLFLRVEKGEDMGLLPLSGNFLINGYRASGSDAYPVTKERYGHMKAWGVTAQGVYRPGDTMQYKIYVRNQDNAHFLAPPLTGYTLRIFDSMGKKVHQADNVKLSEFGSFSGEYTIPKKAAVGWYSFRLSAGFSGKEEGGDEEAESQGHDGDSAEEDNSHAGKGQWVPMRVLVSEFTPSPFKVTGQLNGDHFNASQEVESATRAELHSGGPYTKASARVTALLQSVPFVSKHPLARHFQFDSFENEQDSQQIFQKIEMLDGKGELRERFSIGNPNIVYGSLVVESAVQDDRGKYVTASSHADYTGVDRLVGLQSEGWLYKTGKPATLHYIVVDDRGNPVAGTHVEINIEHESTVAARVKGAGNAYLTEYHTDWKKEAECSGASSSSPEDCVFTPKEAGSYRATATIKDSHGRVHTTRLSGYAVGEGFVVWGDQSDTGLTIIPEKTDYKIGDTARFMVKNPYPGAKALITVERYGVLDHFSQALEGSAPVIEFPVKPDYLPGFYLSVTVMSPRVDKPVEGQVDLGKPAFRMGYLTVPVKDPYKQVTVTARTDKNVYKPRDKVTVRLHAALPRDAQGSPVEMAAVVLDESVFDLIAKGREAFDPYGGFYKLDQLDLRNYSLLLKLVGRQKFEKKGANPGGDGGSREGIMRSLFKFVGYWNPSIVPDKDGNASFTFEAPDNLTGWKVLVLADTPGDSFGLGEAGFKVNRPTEIRPVMPNQVTEGDSFSAGFSVMNRTDKQRTLEVAVKASGDVGAVPAFVRTVTVPPYQRTTVFMPVKASAVSLSDDVSEGRITFTASAGDGTDGDALEHAVSVHKQRSLDFAANYATTTEPHASESLQFPAGIMPDVGSVSIVLSPSVIGNLTGAFKYMYDYPYLCWEQQLTKGVMAAHYKELKPYLPAAFEWKGSESLPQGTLDNASLFQAPNGGMAYFTAADAYVDPYLSAYTSLAFNWLRRDGYAVPSGVESRLDAYLDNLLRQDAVPDFYSEGMSSSVRAVALNALAGHDKLASGDLDRYLPFVPKMGLFGKANYLQAALKTGAKTEIIDGVVKQILAASSQTGGKFIFSETLDDGYRRILASPLRDNCAVLDALVQYAATPKGKERLADVPFKLVRAITQSRGNRDHWENTQENIFCMNALTDYARAYESVPPAMTVTADMDGAPLGETAFKSLRDAPVTFERPVGHDDPGRKTSVEIEKQGEGRLYYSTRMTYALPPSDTHAENAGIEMHREYSVERGGAWEILKDRMEVKRGELVRVDLYVSVPAARNFVVVDDPIPGGLEPVNADLATASAVDAAKGGFKAAGGSWWFHYSDWSDYGVSRWSFYHKELRNDAARFYSDYLPAGNYHLSYTAQAVAAGSFTVMPALAQEMYDPDVYGKTEAATLRVNEP